MNRLVYIAAGSALLVFGAAAQDNDLVKAKLKAETESLVQMKMMGAVRGMTVKGAPYSADEINETTQVLADGTRIHRENKTSIFRDSEGRVRRETPENITITDPVANVTYILNPKSMTGQKLTMAAGNFAFFNTNGATTQHVMADGPETSSFTVTTTKDGQPTTITVNGQKLDEKAVQEAIAKAKVSRDAGTQTMTIERTMSTRSDGAVGWAVGGGMAMAAPAGVMRRKLAGESLGKQMIEGVNAEGTRNVSTIEAGAIGNDRPIQVTSESWYSDELQMAILTKHSDPRTGDESFRVTNINRGDPGAYLFQPPAGYQITEHK